MDRSRKPLGEHTVDPLVAFDAALTCELSVTSTTLKWVSESGGTLWRKLSFSTVSSRGWNAASSAAVISDWTVIRVSAYPGMLFYVEIAIECFGSTPPHER